MSTIDIAAVMGLTERSVTTNGRRSAIRMTRSFDTSAEDLWDACTDPARMRRWLGEATGEFHEGGAVRLCMTPPDQNVAMLEIVRCDVPRRLVVRWSESEQADTFVEMNLAPTPSGQTTLSLEHFALTGTLPTGFGGGWEDFLIRLGEVLDGDHDSHEWTDVEQPLTAAWNDVMTNASDDGRWPTVEPGADDDSVALAANHRYAVGRAEVWAAITDRVLLSAWMAPITGDLRIGGDWTMAFDNGSASGTITACEPGERLVTTWGWAHESDRPAGTVTVELADAVGGGTAVSIRHDGAATPGEGYAAGWYGFLRKIERHLAGRHSAEADWQADWTEAMAMIRP